jgi:hypothetical protein
MRCDAHQQQRSFLRARPRAETQPQLQPALLRLSAMIFQYRNDAGTLTIAASTSLWETAAASNIATVFRFHRERLRSHTHCAPII